VLVAVVHAVQRGDVATALTSSLVALSPIVCPLDDAGVCRRSEYAADRYVATCDTGPHWCRRAGDRRASLVVQGELDTRMLDRRPSVDRHLEVLDPSVVRRDARPPEGVGERKCLARLVDNVDASSVKRCACRCDLEPDEDRANDLDVGTGVQHRNRKKSFAANPANARVPENQRSMPVTNTTKGERKALTR